MVGGQVPPVPRSGEGNLLPIQECGKNGNPCATIDQYPVCDPPSPQDGWVGLNRLMMYDNPQTHVSEISLTPFGAPVDLKYRHPLPMDFPQTPKVDDNEIKAILNGRDPETQKYYLETRGYAGICRSQYGNSLEPYKWYAYRQRAGMEGFITLFNEAPAQVSLDPYRDTRGFKLTAQEMFGLATCPQLGLNTYDVQCRYGMCPKEQPNGGFSEGDYLFTNDPRRLEPIIAVLRDPMVPISNLKDERRVQLRQHLEQVLQDSPLMAQRKQTSFLDVNSYLAVYGALTTTALLYFIGQEPMKKIWAKFRGNIRVLDFEEQLREKLKKDPNYDIFGRDRVASEAWRMADMQDPITGEQLFRNLIFNAPTREGKDVAVEKMLLMKVKGDPRVPERFRKAPVKKFNVAEFIKDTSYRGNVGDKVAEIAAWAQKGPVIVYVSEVDKLFAHGGTTDGNSEEAAGLLLDLLEQKEIKENLIFIGTTSRGEEMLALRPDLQGRFNWPELPRYTVEEIVDILYRGHERREHDGIAPFKMKRGAVELAGELAEQFFRPMTEQKTGTTMPRFSAVNQILGVAAGYAKETGSAELTAAHVLAAAESVCGVSINRSAISAGGQLNVQQAEAALGAQGLSVVPRPKGAAAADPIPPEVAEMMEKIRAADADGFGQMEREVVRAVAEAVVTMKNEGQFNGFQGFKDGEFDPDVLRMVARMAVNQARNVVAQRAAERSAESERESRRVESRWERFKGRLPFIGK